MMEQTENKIVQEETDIEKTIREFIEKKKNEDSDFLNINMACEVRDEDENK